VSNNRLSDLAGVLGLTTLPTRTGDADDGGTTTTRRSDLSSFGCRIKYVSCRRGGADGGDGNGNSEVRLKGRRLRVCNIPSFISVC
jgi:hypothetical protein